MCAEREPKERGPIFKFFVTNEIFLVSVAFVWSVVWVILSLRYSDWQWFSRSGSVTCIIGAVLTCRPILRLTREERISRRKMTLIDQFTDLEKDDQENDSWAGILAIAVLLFGTLIWAYGDLTPKLWEKTRPSFESYSVPLHQIKKYTPTQIPKAGIDWKMEEHLQYSDDEPLTIGDVANRGTVDVFTLDAAVFGGVTGGMLDLYGVDTPVGGSIAGAFAGQVGQSYVDLQRSGFEGAENLQNSVQNYWNQCFSN